MMAAVQRRAALVTVTGFLLLACADSYLLPGNPLLSTVGGAWRTGVAHTYSQGLRAMSRPASGVVMSLGKKSTAKDVVDHFKVDLRGKVAVVTGGNSGIGLETVKALTSAGCRVILASRSVQPAEQAIDEEIKATGGRKVTGGYAVMNPDIKVLPLDLADLASVNEFAKEVSKEQRIDFLVLNAGIMNTPQGYTKQGFEQQIGVNHFGHFHLTALLLDKMKRQEHPSRIVSVASTAHTMGTIDYDDMHYKTRKYSKWGAYAQSKLANILFAKGLADRLQGTQVTAVSLHPGVIRTPLWRSTPGLLTNLLLPFMADKDIQQGAATTLYACLAQEGIRGGMYLDNCKEKRPFPQAMDPKAPDALWEATEEQLAAVLGNMGLGKQEVENTSA